MTIITTEIVTATIYRTSESCLRNLVRKLENRIHSNIKFNTNMLYQQFRIYSAIRIYRIEI